MQYRNGLFGKHFKTIMQTAAFHIDDITTPEQLSLVKAIGQLGAVLWISEIDDLEAYLVRPFAIAPKLLNLSTRTTFPVF
jgi:hypothetical protein